MGLVTRAVEVVWPAGTWRATVHVLAGLGLVAGGWAVTVALAGLWFAAAYSLATGPTGAPALAVLYVVFTLVGWVPLVWWLPLFTAGQRARFRGELNVPTTPGRWALVVDVEDSVVGSFAARGSAPAVDVFEVVPPRGIEPID